MLWWLLLRARRPERLHVPFARLVDFMDGERASDRSAEREQIAQHVARCTRCAEILREIARVSVVPRPTTVLSVATTQTEAATRPHAMHPRRPERSGEVAPDTALRLIATPAGERVAIALTPWLGDAAARDLLRHARAGDHARRDVLHAVAHPLTAFLGEHAGRALAVHVSQLADPDHGTPRGPVGPHNKRAPADSFRRPFEVGT
jgi:hypothetical protein